jgi:DNA (cytosine-5)-methyltransferase 1
MTLVLSIFPGIGLLDMAFEEEGFCIVRGPDLLWGGNIKRFHPPAGVFDGVIGGSPCQAFTRLAPLIKHNGYQLAENLVPEFERVVAEAKPAWFLHENVRGAPIPSVSEYIVDPAIVNNRWLGEEQSREHRMSFGSRKEPMRLDISPQCAPLDNSAWSPRVLASGGTSSCTGPRKHRKKRTDLHNRLRDRKYFEEAKRLQGLPEDFDLPPFKIREKIRALGNGVPLPLGRAIAKAVKRAIEKDGAP